WPQPQLGLHDYLSVPEVRVPVTEPELRRGQPAAAVGRRDENALEYPGKVAAVGPGVHPDAAADRARDGAGELEAAEPGRASAMQDDGVGGAPVCADDVAHDLDSGEIAKPEDECIHALVCDEQIGAKADSRHREIPVGSPAEQLLYFPDRRRRAQLR